MQRINNLIVAKNALNIFKTNEKDVHSLHNLHRMRRFIHELDGWPGFEWDSNKFLHLLTESRNLQGRLLGKMETLGFDLQSEASLHTLTLEVLKSSEIEGEMLSQPEVRSSLARKLGLEIENPVRNTRNVDGVVEMALDATQNSTKPLTKDRLFNWHSALFPTGRSGMYKIKVGDFRDDSTGPMQVVSGPLGKERVHFQAPDATLLESEVQHYLNWFNADNEFDLVLKAAIAHLWFVTIHPFDDGNGRITRALTEILLSKSDRTSQRFYSMSSQIRLDRKEYYNILEQTQKGDLDITEWISWFLNCLIKSLQATESTLERVLLKANFWRNYAEVSFNSRQHKILNKLLEGFEGKLTSSKWAKINKCSKDSAVRDINDLISKNVLEKESAGGRSTNYVLSTFN